MGSSIRLGIISVPIDIYQTRAGSRLGSVGIEQLNRDSPRSPAAIKRKKKKKKSMDLVACISINFIHHPDVEIR